MRWDEPFYLLLLVGLAAIPVVRAWSRPVGGIALPAHPRPARRRPGPGLLRAASAVVTILALAGPEWEGRALFQPLLALALLLLGAELFWRLGPGRVLEA